MEISTLLYRLGDDKNVIKKGGHRARFGSTMLTNTAKTAPFDHRHTHPILGKKTQYFKCSQWDQVESDFILSFIHLRVRKMYFNAFLITLCSKIDSIWVCSSGPIMDSPHDLIEFIKNIFSDSFCTSWKSCSYQNYEIKMGVTVLVCAPELTMFGPCAPPFVHFSISEWGLGRVSMKYPSRLSTVGRTCMEGIIERATFVIFHCKYGCSMIQM